MTLTVLFLIVAIVCFLIRGLQVKTGKVDLGYIGWAFVFCAVLTTFIH